PRRGDAPGARARPRGSPRKSRSGSRSASASIRPRTDYPSASGAAQTHGPPPFFPPDGAPPGAGGGPEPRRGGGPRATARAVGGGGWAEEGRGVEEALRPCGLPVVVRSLADALGSGEGGPPRRRPDVVVLHERRRREDLLDALERVRRDDLLGTVPLVVVDHER